MNNLNTSEYKVREKKGRIDRIISDFLSRNKEYAVEVYIRSNITDAIIGQIFVTTDRVFTSKEDSCSVEWDVDCGVKFNRFTILYDEVVICFEETDEYGSQTASAIMKCGVSLNFECVGMRV